MNRTSSSVDGNVRMFAAPSWISVDCERHDLTGGVAERLPVVRVEAARVERRQVDAVDLAGRILVPARLQHVLRIPAPRIEVQVAHRQRLSGLHLVAGRELPAAE